MIPEPNLDDRSFDEILAEAIRLIPQYCPEWTNFNKSDPGITLLELFAWMTESVTYRLNRVPEKNFLAFLNLMGLDLLPPQPAKAVLTFVISDKTDKVALPKGLQVATVSTDERDAQVFETEFPLTAVNNRLERVFTQFHDEFTDHSPADNELLVRPEGFPAFGGVLSNERYVFVGDERLVNFTESALLTLRFDAPQTRLGYGLHFDWEYWSGERWVELLPADLELPKNRVAFRGVPRLEKCAVDGVETYWLRGRLNAVPSEPRELELETATMKIEILGEALAPESAVVNTEGDIYLNVPLDKNFAPFGKEPRIDTTFYLRCDAGLAPSNTVIELDVQLSDPSFAEAPVAYDILHRWEYFNGRQWRVLGFSGRLQAPFANPHRFVDETEQLTHGGRIAFDRPDDLARGDVNGEEGVWIRCRIDRGDYGTPGTYELNGDVWEWREERPLKPPYLKFLTVRFLEREHVPERFTTYNDFVYRDFAAELADESARCNPFPVVAEEQPTLFLGFRFPFPNEHVQIFFAVEEVLDVAERPSSTDDAVLADRVLLWEYWNGQRWADLVARDGTRGFTESGFVEFTGPADFKKTKRFGQTEYWIRARLEMGGYDQPPRIRAVLLNSVTALNQQTFHDAVLGSSEGTPNQSFQFNHHPVLPGEQLWVLETAPLTAAEVQRIQAAEGEDSIVEAPDRGGTLIRWHRTDNFFDSDAGARHYVRDVATDHVRFGDGIHGMVPPKGDRNILARVFHVGGGADGNVPAGAIEVLKQKIAFVDAVANLFPASDGANLETLDEVKRRGPHYLKSRDRAVTSEDFEWLALQSSGSVGRVRCLPSRRREGEVTVIVVPKIAGLRADLREKPVPTPILLNRVKRYLDQRRMLTSVVHVVRPRYAEIELVVEIRRYSRAGSGQVKAEIEQALRRFLHPLRGGRDQRGWPFGRGVFKVDLFHVIEELDGVDFVERVRILDATSGRDVEQVKPADDELPFLLGVEVIERGMEHEG